MMRTTGWLSSSVASLFLGVSLLWNLLTVPTTFVQGLVQSATTSTATDDHGQHPFSSSSPRNVHVWNNVLSPDTCYTLHQKASQLGLGHRVFSRPSGNRNIIEDVLDCILTELGDNSNHVEYWTRQEWKNIHAHSDIDEYLAKRQPALEFRYPRMGHVLYLQVGSEVRGPTCIFPHRRTGGDLLRPATNDDGSEHMGDTVELITVPAVVGRLLRFQGDFLHAVPRPTDLWLLNCVQGSPNFYPEDKWGRSVILFNTWGNTPPLEVPIDEKLNEESTYSRPFCNLKDKWNCVFPSHRASPASTTNSIEELKQTQTEDRTAKIWLLGAYRRRDHTLQTLKLRAPAGLGHALEEKSSVSYVTLQRISQ